jgi:hypothetical protein
VKKIFIPAALFILISRGLLAQEFPYGGRTELDASSGEERARQFATPVGAVYIGMPKEDLYEIFAPVQEKEYRKNGPEEWITFSDWTTDEFGDTIIFHLVESKVEGWKKEANEGLSYSMEELGI